MRSLELELGRTIRQARAKAGLTLDQLAGRIGTTRQVVIGWEQGKHLPSSRHRANLTRVLGIQDDGGEDDAEPG